MLPTAPAGACSSSAHRASESGPGRHAPRKVRASGEPGSRAATLKGPAVVRRYATSASPLPSSVTVPACGHSPLHLSHYIAVLCPSFEAHTVAHHGQVYISAQAGHNQL